jgi:hypothetical protein
MKTSILDEELLIKEAVTHLMKKLGPVESARFLSITSRKNRPDSVQRHHLWQRKLKKDEFFDRLFS